MKETLQKQREYFQTGVTLDLDWRIHQLKILKKTIKKYEDNLVWALRDDLGKSEFEAYVSEINMVLTELNNAIKNTPKWAENRSAEGGGLIQYPGKLETHVDPLGLVLLILPWNYPVQMVFSPLIAAVAAGNCVVVKPSNLAPKTEAVIQTIIKETFEEGHVSVFTGGAEVAQELLKEKFDHIFFSGTSEHGKQVMKAAADHLTSVTLQLSGKNPCIVDESADIRIAAKRIIWGKCLNCGQTAVAPDFVMVARSKMDELIDYMHYYLDEFYPDGVMDNPDYPCIINAEQMERLAGYLEEGTVVRGGNYDVEKRKMEPTILVKMDIENSKVMHEEIFGPILPIIPFDKMSEPMKYIINRPKPLALYLFTRDPGVKELVMENVLFGGGCINDTIFHNNNANIPQRGVGESGFGGGYHGKAGFDTFSHVKVILKQSNEIEIPLRYPPYQKKLKIVRSMMNR
ncbi:MAG: aldehyde dehydrogenase family protein [Peptococcaceae bacterium]|nr:aldehyde dehydrogenase family protein [Peptococcaceae bacterium]